LIKLQWKNEPNTRKNIATKMTKTESFKIIGISTETTNQAGKAAADLGQLWARFFAENIPNQIQNKISGEIYAIYTDYESDFTGKYTKIIGANIQQSSD
jgi:predicted transcriptional regulator YdeE